MFFERFLYVSCESIRLFFIVYYYLDQIKYSIEFIFEYYFGKPTCNCLIIH